MNFQLIFMRAEYTEYTFQLPWCNFSFLQSMRDNSKLKGRGCTFRAFNSVTIGITVVAVVSIAVFISAVIVILVSITFIRIVRVKLVASLDLFQIDWV